YSSGDQYSVSNRLQPFKYELSYLSVKMIGFMHRRQGENVSPPKADSAADVHHSPWRGIACLDVLTHPFCRHLGEDNGFQQESHPRVRCAVLPIPVAASIMSLKCAGVKTAPKNGGDFPLILGPGVTRFLCHAGDGGRRACAPGTSAGWNGALLAI